MGTQIAEYRATDAALATLREQYMRPFDVSTTKGMAEAKAALAKIKDYISELERVRVEIKAPVLKRSRLIDEEAKCIAEKLIEIKEHIAAAIKAEKQRKEAEKAAKEQAERDRVAAIHSRIACLRGSIVSAARMSSAEIAAIRGTVNDIEISTEVFAEFLPEALAARAEIVQTLDKMLAEKQQEEQDQARKAAEQAAEEERLKELWRKQVEEARALAEQRAEVERRQKELERIDAEQRAAIALQQHKEQQRIDAENQRIAQQRADLERQQREIEARERNERKRQAREEEMERRRELEKEEAERQRAQVEAEIAAIPDPLRRLEQRVLRELASPYEAICEAYQLGLSDTSISQA